MRICYVILHYQDLETTVLSVKSLLKIVGNDSKIIVVDNASPNNSGNKFKEIFKDYSSIIFIQNKENLGFAQGNNIGYEYSKHKENADIIVVMNNDIIIEQVKFESILLDYFKDNKYHIISPDIINLKGEHQNPLSIKRKSTFQLIYRLIVNLVKYFMIKTRFLVNILDKRLTKKKNIITDNNLGNEFIPHGACLIFTSLYIEKENFAFLPITFLYGEEDILYDYCRKKQYSIKYLPDLSVKHLEDMSTNSMFNDSNKKKLFMLKNIINSILMHIKFRIGLYKS